MINDPYAQRRAHLLSARDEVTAALEEEEDPARADKLRSRLQELDGVLTRLSTHLREPDSVLPWCT